MCDSKTSLVVASQLIPRLDEALFAADLQEVCGFLLGSPASGETVASDLVLMPLAVSTAGEFEISDGDIRRVRVWAADRHLEVMAMVHSHPSGSPNLSEADRNALRYSEWPWVVVTRPKRHGPVTLSVYAQSGTELEVRIKT